MLGKGLAVTLREVQFERRGGEKIPIHGGPGDPNGDFNAINVSWSGDPAEPGYPNVPHGSSFVMVTSFTGGCPDDRSILTYSQSENPNSPYFADQTRMFSRKEWVDPPFCLSEVNGDPSLSTEVVQGSATGATVKRRKCRPKKKRSAVSSRRCHRKKKHRR